MLNHSLLLQELERVEQMLFIDDAPAFDLARMVWKKICSDASFQQKTKQADAPWPVPSWQQKLNQTYKIEKLSNPYSILSVDGSQVYPDRHQSVACYLINIGGILLQYGNKNPVQFFSTPYVFTKDEELVELSTDLVNGKRQELELQKGLELAMQNNHPELLLFDGSLIFWHLEAKDPVLKELFFSKYVASLFRLYQEKILTASYISAPRSRELVNLIRLYLCDFNYKNSEAYKPVERLVDASVCSFFLREGERTILFKNHAHISAQYPDPLHPHFFYINVGNEIGRIEIPAWVAQDESLVNAVAQIVFDQCKKGSGYPVVLAEAHEQAVVKGPDREFFYHLITKMGIERNRIINSSQKMIKKRGLGV